MKNVHYLAVMALCCYLQQGFAEQPALQEPAVLSSQNGQLDLQLTLKEAVQETPCHSITTRLYQHSDNAPTSPGPTLRLKKGDSIKLHLLNNLKPDASEGTPNNFRAANTTNFHTHGLHVSPKKGADDVLYTSIKGGQTLDSQFDIPDYHTPGIYWYHPHVHGSTSIQVGGGALGAIVIEDSASDNIPAEISAIPEHVLVFNQVKIDQMQLMTKAAGDTLWHAEPKTDQCSQPEIDADADSFLVNGQSHPSLDIKYGEWTRLRLVNGAMMNWLELQKPENCEFQLLAKDGIYLDDAPRSIDHAVLPGGGRADIAIRCQSTGKVELTSQMTRSRAFSNQFLWEGELMTLNVTESDNPVAADLPELNYQRPCYLPDLQNVKPDFNETFAMTDDETRNLFQINGHSFNASTPTYQMMLGTTQNFHLENINFHSFHIHISPLQLLVRGGPEDDNYFLPGDWHDTIFMPDLPDEYNSRLKVGYISDEFDGDYVMHCHILPHEDQGMMGYTHVPSNENKTSLCKASSGNSWGAVEWGLAAGIPTVAVTAAVAIGSACLGHYLKRYKGRSSYRPLVDFSETPSQ